MELVASFVVGRIDGLTFAMYSSHFSNFSSFKFFCFVFFVFFCFFFFVQNGDNLEIMNLYAVCISHDRVVARTLDSI